MIATEPFIGTSNSSYKLPINGMSNAEIKAELKNVYIALSRAVEEGDQLMIGIVLGQTLTKLEQIINGN